VPVLHVEVSHMPVYFEHHILLWKDPNVSIEIKPLSGAFSRMIAGMPIFMTRTSGSGRIAFSRDGSGHLASIHMKAGESLDVREHQFLAATDNIDFTFNRVKGAANILVGGSGLFIDTFTCQQQDGILWIHGYGNLFEVTLNSGEQIDIESGGWVYKDKTVSMETIYQNLKTRALGGSGQIFWNRFTGPGRIGIQSMYVHMPSGR
ncbi:MAG: AIM24 family protein, partial [Candidatus Thermoplasmatota archaeon]|nr:AIM24 family protein [Candidatus Thermoplasmatota archaeon]